VRLVALVEHPDHVCCRYRLAAFRPALEQAGHALDLVALPKRWWSRLLLFRRLRGAYVVLQRFLLPGWQLAVLRRQVARLIFDLDDAVFLRDSYSRKSMHHPRRMRRFAATARAADAVVAGNSFLAAVAARHADVRRVHVIPTCVDPDRYVPRTHEGDGKTLAWVGSSITLRGLEAINPLLEALGEAIPGLRLKVICDRFPTFRNLTVIPCPWNSAREAADLAAADVGISWIPDDLWSRGKCGLKVLQYKAAGLPVVANPVGVHPEMIAHNQTGLLAATPEQWYVAVRRLVGDADTRARMGLAARRRLEARYSVAAGARSWLRVLAALSPSSSSPARNAS
jgi:glycosyltransferase involved in cell wall biosynthesis